MAREFDKPYVQLTSAARLLGIKFLDRLVLGSTECNGGTGYVSVMEGQ